MSKIDDVEVVNENGEVVITETKLDKVKAFVKKNKKKIIAGAVVIGLVLVGCAISKGSSEEEELSIEDLDYDETDDQNSNDNTEI